MSSPAVRKPKSVVIPEGGVSFIETFSPDLKDSNSSSNFSPHHSFNNNNNNPEDEEKEKGRKPRSLSFESGKGSEEENLVSFLNSTSIQDQSEDHSELLKSINFHDDVETDPQSSHSAEKKREHISFVHERNYFYCFFRFFSNIENEQRNQLPIHQKKTKDCHIFLETK